MQQTKFPSQDGIRNYLDSYFYNKFFRLPEQELLAIKADANGFDSLIHYSSIEMQVMRGTAEKILIERRMPTSDDKLLTEQEIEILLGEKRGM